MSNTDPAAIQRLASRNPAAALIAAAAARSAATIIATNKPDAIPDAVRDAVAGFAHLLQAALGDAGKLKLDDDC